MINKMKFTSYKNWLMEAKKTQSKKSEYGCIMLYTQIPDWDNKLAIIDKKDIYDDEFHDYGLEHTPHCTLLFGIHLDETEPQDIKKLIATFNPITVTIDTISGFSNDDYDVVKYDVPVTPELKKYHDALLANLPNTQSFPDFHPHMTIAYVNKGEGKKYHQKVKPFKVKFNTAVYSFAAGNSTKKNRIKVKLEE
jgi:2'-5' RNA ligase